MESKLTRGRIVEWLVTLALVAVLSWASKAFTRADTNISTIWLSNGLLLGVILTAPRAHRPALLVAGFLGTWIAGGPIDGWGASIVIALFNVVEVWVASARQRPLAEAQDLTNARTFRRFVWFAVFLGPLVATLLHMVYVTFAFGAPNLTYSASAFVAHALGIATFTPVTMALRRDDISRLVDRERVGEFVLTLLLVTGATMLVFWQERFPLLFLVFPAMLLMAMRGGLGGTAIAIAVVVFLSVGFTVAGHGPLNLARSGPVYQNFFVLQVFIATLLLTMFPMVVVLAENQRAHAAERLSALQLKLLAEHSTDVIVLTDVHARRLYVSPAVLEMFGYTPEEFAKLTYRDYLHPDDRDRVAAELREHARTGDRANITYRAFRKDGREIHVEALVCTFNDEAFETLGRTAHGNREGPPATREGRVVTLRDVTRRRRAEEALAQANSELASLVWKDALTGLANRRRFDEKLNEEWARCSKAGQPLTVVMIDVDHFKAFNDEFGHQQGDHRLIEVAKAIQETLFRPRDLAARYGGEEFAVILPATGVDEAGLVAERIRENIMRLEVGGAAHAFGPVTASVGVAGAIPLPAGRPEDIVKAADDALYTSKREGRNRTTILQVNWPAARAPGMDANLDLGATGTFARRG